MKGTIGRCKFHSRKRKKPGHPPHSPAKSGRKNESLSPISMKQGLCCRSSPPGREERCQVFDKARTTVINRIVGIIAGVVFTSPVCEPTACTHPV